MSGLLESANEIDFIRASIAGGRIHADRVANFLDAFKIDG